MSLTIHKDITDKLDNFIENTVLEKVLEEIKNIPEKEFRYSWVKGLPDVTNNKYCIGDGRKIPSITQKLIDYFKPHNEQLYQLLDRNFGWN